VIICIIMNNFYEISLKIQTSVKSIRSDKSQTIPINDCRNFMIKAGISVNPDFFFLSAIAIVLWLV
jgi:hypothetical protein